jgi:hypothetical protein
VTTRIEFPQNRLQSSSGKRPDTLAPVARGCRHTFQVFLAVKYGADLFKMGQGWIRAIICAKATRLNAFAGTLNALDRRILSQPLTTILNLPNISLDAWIAQAEPTILRCISDANDDHVQTNIIDDNFLLCRRDG